MRKSFYSWLMTQRHSTVNQSLSLLADLAFEDIAFPKHTTDFDIISRYLEDDAAFYFSLKEFDSIWEIYLEH